MDAIKEKDARTIHHRSPKTDQSNQTAALAQQQQQQVLYYMLHAEHRFFLRGPVTFWAIQCTGGTHQHRIHTTLFSSFFLSPLILILWPIGSIPKSIRQQYTLYCYCHSKNVTTGQVHIVVNGWNAAAAAAVSCIFYYTQWLPHTHTTFTCEIGFLYENLLFFNTLLTLLCSFRSLKKKNKI